MKVSKQFCPYCEREHLVEHVVQDIPVCWKGKIYSCTAEWYVCTFSKQEFEMSESRYDPFKEAKEKHEAELI